MPPYPGEERLLTLFADVHYYFAQPAIRPLRHRFDKASYFYVYYNSTRQTSRIEIANNPGTSTQDAVHGYLDKCRVVNATKFPTLVTLTVDAEGLSASPTSPIQRDPDEWRLESGDPRETSRERHKVHTLDIYFWVQEDARLAVDFFKKLLTPSQLDVGELSSARSASKSHDNVSPVVKNLENVAISDPAYQNGQTRNSQNQSHAIPVKLPPPPPVGEGARQSSPSVVSPNASAISQSSARQSPAPSQTTTNFTPMAYNPAAPAAPEPISHREKTPPPEDDGQGTGLAHIASHDNAYQSQHPSQQYMTASGPQPPRSHWGSPPPPSTSTFGSPPPSSSAYGSPAPPVPAYGSPPPPSVTPGYSYTSSVGHASPPPQPQQTRASSTPSHTQSFAPPPSATDAFSGAQDPHRHSAAAETYTPDSQHYQQQPVETPGTQFYNTLPHDRKPLQHVQPRYQTEYFSQTGSAAYPLSAHGGSGGGGGNEYNVHQQAYVPDAAELRHGHKPSKPEKKPSSKAESGSSMLKGLGKRFNSTANKLADKLENNKYV